MAKSKFEHLLQPGKIGSMEVRNRIAFPPMITEHSDRDGFITQKQVDYYAERSKGGCGLIIVEASCVQAPVGRGFVTQINLDDDKYVPGLTRLAEGINKHGARSCMQLYHAGNAAHPHVTHMQPVGPSAVYYPGGLFYQASREITRAEMEETKQCFVKAAIRCEKAGFDSLILHSNHQYLLTNFLSPVWNKRTDEYGGSIENRARYPIEVLKAVRAAVKIPVLVRINALEYGGKEILGVDKEYTLEEAMQFAAIYAANGAAAIHLSTWGYGPYVHRGLFPLTWAERLPLIAAIKSAVTVPVIGFGRFTPELADGAIKDGKADYISFGRGQIVDPYFAQKVTEGKTSEITPCIACYKCEPQSQLGLPTDGLHCSVNARAGYEAEFAYPLEKSGKQKSVVVVGGGPAGMEAARVAARRGHRVTLFEQSKQLGGLLLAADKAPEKQSMGLLAPYLEDAIKKAGVKVVKGKKATAEIILQQRPDVVIIAAGGQPITARIKGLDKARMVQAIDILRDRAEAGNKTIVIGAGMQGLEAAEVLASRGKKITICEVLPEAGAGINPHMRDISVKILNDSGAQFFLGVTSEEITDHGMVIKDNDGKAHTVEFDTIVMAAGSTPNDSLAVELQGKVTEVHTIGDARKARFVIDAVSEGFRTAYAL